MPRTIKIHLTVEITGKSAENVIKSTENQYVSLWEHGSDMCFKLELLKHIKEELMSQIYEVNGELMLTDSTPELTEVELQKEITVSSP